MLQGLGILALGRVAQAFSNHTSGIQVISTCCRETLAMTQQRLTRYIYIYIYIYIYLFIFMRNTSAALGSQEAIFSTWRMLLNYRSGY